MSFMISSFLDMPSAFGTYIAYYVQLRCFGSDALGSYALLSLGYATVHLLVISLPCISDHPLELFAPLYSCCWAWEALKLIQCDVYLGIPLRTLSCCAHLLRSLFEDLADAFIGDFLLKSSSALPSVLWSASMLRFSV